MALSYGFVSSNGILPILIKDTEKETTFLVFSRSLPDYVCINSDGSFNESEAIPLLDENGDPIWTTHPSLRKQSKQINKQLTNSGEYSYLVLLNHGLISTTMEGVIADTVCKQEFFNRNLDYNLTTADAASLLKLVTRKGKQLKALNLEPTASLEQQLEPTENDAD